MFQEPAKMQQGPRGRVTASELGTVSSGSCNGNQQVFIGSRVLDRQGPLYPKQRVSSAKTL